MDQAGQSFNGNNERTTARVHIDVALQNQRPVILCLPDENECSLKELFGIALDTKNAPMTSIQAWEKKRHKNGYKSYAKQDVQDYGAFAHTLDRAVKRRCEVSVAYAGHLTGLYNFDKRDPNASHGYEYLEDSLRDSHERHGHALYADSETVIGFPRLIREFGRNGIAIPYVDASQSGLQWKALPGFAADPLPQPTVQQSLLDQQ